MKNTNSKKGISLIEMIIVMAIIGMIFAVGTNTYSNQRQIVQFNDSLTKVVSLFQTARVYASTSRSVMIGGELEVPSEGYGVYINKTNNEFILFANTSITGNNIDKYDASDIEEETYVLPSVTEFEEFLEDNKAAIFGDPQEIVIIFRPPLADAEIANNTTPTQTIETLYLQFLRNGAPEDAKKYIKFNKTAGFPEVEL